MRVGIDAHNAEQEGEGNSTYARNLIRAALALGTGDIFALLAGNPSHPFYASLDAPGRLRVHPVGRRGGGVPRILWRLSRAARRARVDCLHVQYFAPAGYPGPLVVTVHDLGFLHVPDSFPPGLRVAMRVLVPWSLRRASRVITVSEFVRRDLAAQYRVPSEKIAVTPEGVDERFRPLADAEIRQVLRRYGLEPGYLFALGRLNRRKNLERLFLAYGALRRDGAADVPLVIAGKPDYGAEQARRSALRSRDTDRIRWVGFVPDEDLPAFYAGAACFVYPSLFEGFGLPVLEAMACGCPVVSSDRAALPELIGDAGLAVDPERVDAIAGAVARVLADATLRAELRERGLARSRQFTWRETARRTLAVYRETLA